jgi:hypothetical protein
MNSDLVWPLALLSANEGSSLNDTGHRQNAYARVKQLGRQWRLWLVGYVKRKYHECRAKKMNETPEQRAIRWTMWSTAAIAVFTVVLAYVSYFQLREMREAGIDTKRSIDIAQNALVASNRPWVNAEVQLTGPLTFDGQGAHLPIMITLKNIGHSPAISVWSDEELYMAVNPQLDTERERARQCNETVKRSLTMGQTIFPETNGMSGRVDTATNDIVQKGTFLNPTIIVCVTYQSTLHDNTWYSTSMVYDLHRIDERGIEFAVKNGEDVPLNRLEFTLSFFHGVTTEEKKQECPNPN